MAGHVQKLSRKRISRRTFLGAAAATVAAGTPMGCWLRSHPKRNVILVISDSMRRDALGCYGGNWIATPNLDRFASEGVRFDNAYVSTFPTVPARNDMLTGTYTFTYKLWGPLDRDAFTLQDALNAKGVYTALVADTPHPFQEHFNYQRGFQWAKRIPGQEDDKYITAPIPVKFPCDPRKMRFLENVTQYLRNVSNRHSEEDWFSPQTMSTAARWLKDNAGTKQPFFLYVDTFDPHEPWDPPKHYVERYDPGYTGQDVIYPHYDRWRDFLTEAEMRHCRALYAGEAAMVDHWFGHLMETVRDVGLLENTLILFVADHGFRLGERGYIGKTVIRDHVPMNFPLYPEISRIPLLAYWPGCKPGSAIPALAQPVNLPATILDYLGVPAPSDFEAPSLWPVMQGKVDRVTDLVISAPTLSFPKLPGKDRVPRPTDQPTITDGRWLLIYSCAGWGDELYKRPHQPDYKAKRVALYTGMSLDPQLYDLAADPECLTNVYRGNKDCAKDLHRRFYQFLVNSRRFRRDHLPYFSQLENS